MRFAVVPWGRSLRRCSKRGANTGAARKLNLRVYSFCVRISAMRKAIAVVACLWAQAAFSAGSPDRHVAEWVLYMGGNVRLAGDPRTIDDPSQLPAGDFSVESIDLIGAHSLDPPDLKRLSSLQH